MSPGWRWIDQAGKAQFRATPEYRHFDSMPEPIRPEILASRSLAAGGTKTKWESGGQGSVGASQFRLSHTLPPKFIEDRTRACTVQGPSRRHARRALTGKAPPGDRGGMRAGPPARASIAFGSSINGRIVPHMSNRSADHSISLSFSISISISISTVAAPSRSCCHPACERNRPVIPHPPGIGPPPTARLPLPTTARRRGAGAQP